MSLKVSLLIFLSSLIFLTACTVIANRLALSRVAHVGEVAQFVCPHQNDLLYRRPPRSEVNYTLVTSGPNSTGDLNDLQWSLDFAENGVTWTIDSVGLADAGKYRCVGGEGKIEATSELIVIESPPTCHSSTDTWPAEADCDSQSESNATLTCAITFSGDVSPVMTWRESDKREITAPSYYEENNSTATSRLVASHGKRFTCVVLFSSLESLFSYTCQPMISRPCGTDRTGVHSLTDSYLVIIVTSIVIISLSICLCIFYVVTFVWLNWRIPVRETRKSETLHEVPIIDINSVDNYSDIDDDDDTRPDVGESSQATSV